MIRVGTAEDIERCIELAALMHQQSTSSHRPFVPAKLRETFIAVIEKPDAVLYVHERDGEVVGGIVASVAEEFYNHELIGYEHVIYVHPKYRHGFIATRLFMAFQAWAKELGAIEIRAGITSGINEHDTAAFYRSLGFMSTGPQFSKRVY